MTNDVEDLVQAKETEYTRGAVDVLELVRADIKRGYEST